MRDSVLEPESARAEPSTPAHYRSPSSFPTSRRLKPSDLARWLEEHREDLAERWLEEVASRAPRPDGVEEDLLRDFFGLFAEILPAIFGPYRDQVDPLWRELSELYGQVGAMRGCAAGEVIEEVQQLRDGLIRLLYHDPPDTSHGQLGLREILQLHGTVDRGVTHASVGHTDALFFALFKGTGVPENLSPEQLEDVRRQLEVIGDEYGSLMELRER